MPLDFKPGIRDRRSGIFLTPALEASRNSLESPGKQAQEMNQEEWGHVRSLREGLHFPAEVPSWLGVSTRGRSFWVVIVPHIHFLVPCY